MEMRQRQLRTSAALQSLSQNLSRLRTRRAIVREMYSLSVMTNTGTEILLLLV